MKSRQKICRREFVTHPDVHLSCFSSLEDLHTCMFMLPTMEENRVQVGRPENLPSDYRRSTAAQLRVASIRKTCNKQDEVSKTKDCNNIRSTTVNAPCCPVCKWCAKQRKPAGRTGVSTAPESNTTTRRSHNHKTCYHTVGRSCASKEISPCKRTEKCSYRRSRRH